MKSLLILLSVALALSVGVLEAHAKPITFSFTAIVASTEREFPTVHAGDLVIGHYTFESTTPDSDPNPARGVYLSAGTFDAKIGTLTFNFPLSEIEVLNNFAGSQDRYTVIALSGNTAGKIEEGAKRAHISIQQCVQKAQAEGAELKAILSSPERLRAEAPEWLMTLERDHQLAEARREAEDRDRTWRSEAILRAEQEMRAAAEAKEAAERQLAERLGEGLREQWLSVLENARGAHEIFVWGASYEASYLRLEAISKQIQATRGKYARQLQMGDHKPLSMAVYAAYDALSAAHPYWQRERRAAETLATAEMNAARFRGTSNASLLDRSNADESKRRLREAQQQYTDAKTQLAVNRDLLTQMMSETIRVATEVHLRRFPSHHTSAEKETQ
jgi:hypothetical protein